MKLKVKEEWKTETGKYKCPYCNKEYSKKGICSHIWKMHGEGKDHDPNRCHNICSDVQIIPSGPKQ